uniref:Lipocalin n=1 Tax=Rhipicephalus appendiculatus TaxID=34631 RepID=A0A131YUS1_RHIAP
MLSVWVLALVLSISGSTREIAAQKGSFQNNLDIRQYYSTNETSWTYNTTKRTVYRCVRDTTYSITDENVTYIRHSLQYNSSVTANLTGKFIHESEHLKARARQSGGLYRSMNVFEDGELWWNETLEYMSANGDCGVFTVMVPRSRNRARVSHDLRLKDSAVGSTPDQECRNKFNSLRGNSTVTTLYTSVCKEKIRRSTNVVSRVK